MCPVTKTWPEWYRVIRGIDLLSVDAEFKFNSIPEGLWKNVQRRAAVLLKEQPHASNKELEHWKSIVNGTVPFNLTIARKGRK